MSIQYRLVVKLWNLARPMKYPKRDLAAALKDREHYLDPENYWGRRMPVVWIESREVSKWEKVTDV